ncbi:hypothetical protein ATE92_2096 [Ulvibacter sp. MAR_2010_11]|uniref:hypothetical protein n=1 Tax=Ulvibacter sp. MAR_2010_11 TaxID=1250229 RepID=UPI000C2CA236|nr:hypothetical protein [Ulvibacter sp. MAR_2010_11]PKA83927.1 hypothetical protein ATE92_2096 [Ulvibacter sp. MAR_2010_11]
MKYKSTGTRAGHKIFVRKRETNFDKSAPLKSSFGTFEDHKEMKTYAYAAFQKRMFKKRRGEQRKLRLIVITTIAIVIIIYLLTPSIIEFMFGDRHRPILFQ